MYRCFTSVFLLAAISMVLGTTTQPATVDLGPTLAPIMAQYKLPGLVGAIVEGDKIIAIGSAGVRKVGDTTPFLATDMIHLGSDTKAMTAMLIGQLVDRKQLRFDTPMREIFPELAGKMNSEMGGVTVRDLLVHDAGFSHDVLWAVIDATHLPLPAQRRMAVQMALASPPASPIGQFSYSNVDYVLLVAIVERKLGMSWEDATRRKIFRPLHMDSAGFGPPGRTGTVDEPWGHVMENGEMKALQADNPPVMGPAGRVHCSIGDWGKFIAEVLRSERGNPRLVSAETFKELLTPVAGQEYAGGWIITDRSWAGGLTLTHAGSNTMWFCVAWVAPKKNFAVLAATNDGAEAAPEATDKAAAALIGVYEGIGAKR
jgi:CubicO group peptidase (beta-lactamase class C family)